jgi:peroxiredoxin
MRTAAFCMAAALFWATLAAAQVGPKTPDPLPPTGPQTTDPAAPSPSRTGVNVAGAAALGETAPDFELDGASGHPVKLSKLRGDWVVLVFAERRDHLLDLGAKAADLRALGAVILGVCDEKSGTLSREQQRRPLPFLVAADPTGEVSAMYGLYDRIHTTTEPGFLVLDRRGVVRLAVVGQQLPADDVFELARMSIRGAH